jgi:cytochrome c peroxidase
MKNKLSYYLLLFSAVIFILNACNKNEDDLPSNDLYDDTPYEIDYPARRFPKLNIPEENPLTVTKVDLGRKLFYDPIISIDSSMSCASCHNPQFNFTDNGNANSINAIGGQTQRISMPLIYQGYIRNGFFWDGRATTLEDAVMDAIMEEHHPDWTASLEKMNNNLSYQEDFQKAFRNGSINEENIAKALATFLRILIPKDSEFDQFVQSDGQIPFSDELATYGFVSVFTTEVGDCFHCHGIYPFMTENVFINNGLQDANSINEFSDIGFGGTTGNTTDYGKFKIPSLRNLAYSAPYMHDGRFETLDEVLDFYSEGVHQSPNISPLMKQANQGGVQLSDYDKAALKAFLLTLSDETFINNPEFSNPFE